MPDSNAAALAHTPTSAYDVRVASRFNGPPGSGNGGWSVALLGKHLGPQVEVTLKRPVPLDRTLQVVCDDATATLQREELVIASARRAELDLDVPDPVGVATAMEARVQFPGYRAHPFPDCFVCGTDRCSGKGMNLFTGPLQNGIVASSWTPAEEFAMAGGGVAPELVCAALDCPGAWALIDRYGIDGPFVLGRMTYRLSKAIQPDETYVVMGWARGRDGRKAFCGTAVYDTHGEVCASAAATWIELR
jgi:hypothetical protein